MIAEVFRHVLARVLALGGGAGSSLAVDAVKLLVSKCAMRESLSYWLTLGAAVLVVSPVNFSRGSAKG